MRTVVFTELSPLQLHAKPAELSTSDLLHGISKLSTSNLLHKFELEKPSRSSMKNSLLQNFCTNWPKVCL